MRDSSGGEKPAGGPASALAVLRHVRQMGLRRGLFALSQVNQAHGFDCPGCAWPDPDLRGPIEFCENGAKAIAHEATPRRLERAFFERHTLADLRAQSDH